jgi:hypothetical protein
MYGEEFNIIIFEKNDIDNDFINKNKSILNCNRGGGYWLWKPYIINKTLKKINDDDIIFYIDSKYYFIEHFANLYVDYMENNDILVWKNKPNETIWYMKNWCKMHVIYKYEMPHLFQIWLITHVENLHIHFLIIKLLQVITKYLCYPVQ